MNYVERCLYNYLENIAKLEMLQMELSSLMSVQGQSYAINSGNGNSDPVSDITARILRIEGKIYQTERRVEPVRRLKSELMNSPDVRICQMSGILRLRYFSHMYHNQAMREMAISRNTYWRRHDELLRKARRYFDELR